MKDEYLKKGDFNFIQVDWGSIAFGSYLLIAKNTQNIGRELGDVIVENNLPLSNVHIIGHSLGSHIAAYASRRISQLLNATVKRISALDPAGPLFELLPILQGLRKTDAEIVDVIHADGGFFGMRNPVGTVDFYPNSGQRHQPGCTKSMILSQPNYTLEDIIFCSHRKSYHYFIESINNRVFKAKECQSWEEFVRGNCNGATAVMGDGYEKEPHSIGRFYLSTENN
ncbi:hypothetical protein PPYR_07806 [Photinus pyralis]|nr:hypothetical protein PPYR_07806 [Photinus pyralis]